MAGWFTQSWMDLLQNVGILSTIGFTVYSLRREETSRRNANMLTVATRHHDIWKQLVERPELSRIRAERADLEANPLSDEEQVFITGLIVHLDTVYRSMKMKMVVPIEGLRKDVKNFFSRPVPKAAWEKLKPFQDGDFVKFVEQSLNS
jgi:hypothetical protein